MRLTRCLAVLLALCLLLVRPAGAVDSVTDSPDTLEGKTLLVLGDSYTASYGLDDPSQGWNYLAADACGMTQLNYAISGSSFAAGPGGAYPMVERCKLLPRDADPDVVLLQGGSNDYAKNIPIGQDTDRQADTFCGALNLILDTLTEMYPEATVICFTPWISDGTRNETGATAQDYTNAMLRICTQREVLCYNAANAEENGMYLNGSDFRAEYCLTAGDWYHLNAQGHARFAPVFAGWLEGTLCHTGLADRFYDLAMADESLRDAVSQLTAAGILSGTGEHLFSPSRTATRQALVLTLYRMAGSPSAGDRPLEDVEAGTETYAAVCWAMDYGVFAPAGYFSPSQAVTREMLATVLYRYYTQYSGLSPDSLTGTGAFPDGSAVADHAQVPMGWALSAGVLSPCQGELRPKSTVSRGDLALSLAVLRRLL